MKRYSHSLRHQRTTVQGSKSVRHHPQVSQLSTGRTGGEEHDSGNQQSQDFRVHSVSLRGRQQFRAPHTGEIVRKKPDSEHLSAARQGREDGEEPVGLDERETRDQFKSGFDVKIL